MKPNLKIVGALVSLAGVVITLVNNKVEEEKMKAEVRKTVDEVLAEREQNDEEESE